MNYKAAHPKLLILNYNYYLSFVKLFAAVLLFFAGFNQSSDYYSWLRIIIFIISIYSLYESKLRFDILSLNQFSKNEARGIYILLFAIIAVLFNPLVPIYLFEKTIWSFIDFAGIIIFITSFFSFSTEDSIWYSALIMYDYKLRNKLNSSNLLLLAKEIEYNISQENNFSNIDLSNINYLYIKAIEIEPLNPKPYFRRGLLSLKYNSHFFEDIIQDLRNAIKLGEQNTYVNLYLGIAMLWSIIETPQINSLNSNRINKFNEAINESLFDCTELFKKQIIINNSSVAYFLFLAAFLLMTNKKIASKVILPENLDEEAEAVFKIIEPNEQNLAVYIYEKLMKYSVNDFLLKISPILEQEDKNFLK